MTIKTSMKEINEFKNMISNNEKNPYKYVLHKAYSKKAFQNLNRESYFVISVDSK